ncbi:MAG: hypothetical protein IBX45_02225 [Campylobacterales bacterium]|nr:hypothetical protein [Campylobacterales bacterium]
MKIALSCRSILLEKALSLFLKPHIVPLKQCDFVVCDHEATLGTPLFRIGINTPFPFSKSALMLALENFYTSLKTTALIEQEPLCSVAPVAKDFSKLEAVLSAITAKYQEDVLKAVREHYEG